MAHHLAAAAGVTAGVQYRRAPSIVHRTATQDDRTSSQHSTSRVDLSSSVESDLCCMEDSWDKESPAPAKPCPASTRVAPAPEPQARSSARQTPSERAQLRRSRPEAPPLGAAALSAEAIRQDSPREERLDSLLKMLSGEDKFRPLGAAGGGRARCHSVSPFVVERRRCFVTWMNKMATFLGYSRDTVAVALNYFDRYTCARPCSPTTAQAVAATALHLAAKFEETNPASLRQLIKYIAVFTPDQLLVMEMSMLKVLNWDLRPATNYDFVRAFCDLLPSASESLSGMPLTLPNKEDEAEETERLRVGAEGIADLSSNEICFVDFLPSTVATATILVSVSLGPSSPYSSSPSSLSSERAVSEPEMDYFAFDLASRPSSAAASHEDVLQTCCIGYADTQDDAAAPAAAAAQLRSILKCVRLLEHHLAAEHPAISAAASDAADRVARYAGLVDEPRQRGGANGNGVSGGGGGGAKIKVASGAGGASEGGAELGGRKKVSAVGSAAGQAKGRRCSTPTGVEGIVHIEMAAIRNSSVDNSVGPEAESGGAEGGVGVVHEPAKLSGPAKISGLDKSAVVAAPKAASSAAGGDGEGTVAQHPRPAPCATRPSGGSFRFSSEDVAFARAAKRKKTRGAASSCGSIAAPTSRIRTAKTAAAAATMAAATAMTTAAVAAPTAAAAKAVMAPAATSMTKTGMVQTTSWLTLRGTGSVSWQPFSSSSSWRSAKPGGSGEAGAGVGFLAGSSLLCSRKRSAEALGHCESGSGFGAPVPRVSKTATRDTTPFDTAAG